MITTLSTITLILIIGYLILKLKGDTIMMDTNGTVYLISKHNVTYYLFETLFRPNKNISI